MMKMTPVSFKSNDIKAIQFDGSQEHVYEIMDELNAFQISYHKDDEDSPEITLDCSIKSGFFFIHQGEWIVQIGNNLFGLTDESFKQQFEIKES